VSIKETFLVDLIPDKKPLLGKLVYLIHAWRVVISSVFPS
jgi:hypothetical protein